MVWPIIPEDAWCVAVASSYGRGIRQSTNEGFTQDAKSLQIGSPQILGGAAIHRCDHQSSPKAGFSRRGEKPARIKLPENSTLDFGWRSDSSLRSPEQSQGRL
jgi:hypothetical protein